MLLCLHGHGIVRQTTPSGGTVAVKPAGETASGKNTAQERWACLTASLISERDEGLLKATEWAWLAALALIDLGRPLTNAAQARLHGNWLSISITSQRRWNMMTNFVH